MSELEPTVELLGIYSITGEELIVEISEHDVVTLYDRQGLQHRIVTRNKAGFSTDVEESALVQISSFRPFGC